MISQHRIEKLACLQQVVDVIGYNPAVYELLEVGKTQNIMIDERGIIGSFIFYDSIQGFDFWSRINVGLKPNKYEGI